jgi:hypothetical protein
MTAGSTRSGATGADRPREPRLGRIGERAGLGAVLAALGICCATALVGPAVVAGAAGAVLGVVAGTVAGSAWLLVPLVVAACVAAAWFGVGRRRPRP